MGRVANRKVTKPSPYGRKRPREASFVVRCLLSALEAFGSVAEKPLNRTCAGQLQAVNPLVRDTDFAPVKNNNSENPALGN